MSTSEVSSMDSLSADLDNIIKQVDELSKKYLKQENINEPPKVANPSSDTNQTQDGTKRKKKRISVKKVLKDKMRRSQRKKKSRSKK